MTIRFIVFPDAAGAVTHDTTGALSGQGASVVGTAAHVAVHATSGVLAGSGSSVVGASNRFRAFPTSGDLSGQGSSVSGSAARSSAGLHDTSGALAGPGSSVSGTSAHIAVHASSGVLQGAGSVVDGAATHNTSHATSGDLVGSGAQIIAIAVHSGSGAESGKTGGDDVPLSRKQLKELAKRERQAEENRRKRWAQNQENEEALSREIERLYKRIQGGESEEAPEIVLEAPKPAIIEAVKSLPVEPDNFSAVVAQMLQVIDQARAYQEHRKRLMDEDELILMMVA